MADPGEVLATCRDLKLRFSSQIVLDDAALTIHAGDKLGMVGRNGSGKSSFLRILARVDEPDSGDIAWKSSLIVGYLPQEFALRNDATVLDNVRDGARHILDLIDRFESGQGTDSQLADLQNRIETMEGWSLEPRIETAMKELSVPAADRLVGELSGGEKRRVALCRAIVGEPELLILDEPTNHLDAESIEWLEGFLHAYQGATVFVTHDRYFLDRIASRIAELDNGRFFSHEGGYSDYLAARAERKESEQNVETRRQSFLRRELEWVRAGVQARRTKEQSRLDRFHETASLDAPKEELDIQLLIPPPPRLGNIVVNLRGVGMDRGRRQLFSGLDLEFEAGTCTGVIGRNGLGKTTLLNVIMGILEPSEGEAVIGERTQFNYADQSRMALDGSKSLVDEVGAGSDYVQFGNQRLHIRNYLARFLFNDEQVHARIDTLSGGEQNRVMMAKLLRKGGNFLILDEPTNDLDLGTLRMLEEAILAFEGVALVVSHDRYFLDRVADRILAFEGGGRVIVQAGNYSYYAEKRRERLAARRASGRTAAAVAAVPAGQQPKGKPRQERTRKLTYREERELEGMEEAILGVESRIKEIDAQLNDPEFYRTGASEASAVTEQRNELKKRAESLYARWEELEAIRLAAEAG